MPRAVISNFVKPPQQTLDQQLLGALGKHQRPRSRQEPPLLAERPAEVKQVGRPLTLDLFDQGPLRHDLGQRATSLALEGQVCFHGYRRNVRDFLPGYRAYIDASYAETSSFSIIEATAVGLPIVAARVGGGEVGKAPSD